MSSKNQSDASLLGIIGRSIPPSATLDRLVRFLSSYSGSDKAFELVQYTLKLLIPILNARARLLHGQGKRDSQGSAVATSFSKLAGIISDSRMLWRMFGLLPIVKWLGTLESSPPSNPRLLTIERLQALSMLVYYPLEHLYYFGSHSVYPMTSQRLKTLSLWSTRAWAAYILLQFLHLREDVAGLKERARLVRLEKRKREASSSGKPSPPGADDALAEESKDIKKKETSLKRDFFANVANLPQSVHWSTESGIFANQVWLDVLGFSSAVLSAKNSWAAVA